MSRVADACPERASRAVSNAPKDPRIVSSESPDAARRRYELHVPAELRWFEGHFPGHPVLPGVAQTGWAIRLAREAFELPADPPCIDRIKFQRPVCPGDRLQLELSCSEPHEGIRVDWTFRRAGEIVSRGRLEFDG